MNINVLRSESTGSIHVKSADPAEPPAIRFNFLSARADREGLLAAIRKGRELMATSPLSEITGEEIAPGKHVQTDDELLDWVRKNAETTVIPDTTVVVSREAAFPPLPNNASTDALASSRTPAFCSSCFARWCSACSKELSSCSRASSWFARAWTSSSPGGRIVATSCSRRSSVCSFL